VPQGVTRVEDFAFEYSTLTNITFPNSLIEIGKDSFYQSYLRAVTIPDSVRNIDEGAFGGSSIGTATIGNGVTNIAQSAFGSCSLMTNVIIGSGLVTLDTFAFGFCWSLRAVYFNGNAPVPGDVVFDNAPATIYYRIGTSGWGSYFAGRPTALWSP
jgi:hypothetical protein